MMGYSAQDILASFRKDGFARVPLNVPRTDFEKTVGLFRDFHDSLTVDQKCDSFSMEGTANQRISSGYDNPYVENEIFQFVPGMGAKFPDTKVTAEFLESAGKLYGIVHQHAIDIVQKLDEAVPGLAGIAYDPSNLKNFVLRFVISTGHYETFTSHIDGSVLTEQIYASGPGLEIRKPRGIIYRWQRVGYEDGSAILFPGAGMDNSDLTNGVSAGVHRVIERGNSVDKIQRVSILMLVEALRSTKMQKLEEMVSGIAV